MTQSVSSNNQPHAEPGPDRERGLASADSPLTRLIRGEFTQSRLMSALDLGEERVPDRLWATALSGPLLELLERPGKEFRSRLVEVAYDVGGGTRSRRMPEQLPLLVEILHAGSLIIDDIEDDSRCRRGKPTLHLLVGVPLALNAGNWLYFLPHSVLERMQLEPAVELELRRALDRGVLRCHYGQALDLGARLGSLAQREVHDVVSLSTRLKTGSLLELAAELGGLAAGAEPRLLTELSQFGRNYGVALQMLDDLSGLYEPGRAHKGHEDLMQGRPTWPWAWLAQRVDELSYSRLQHRAREVERRELHPEELAKHLRKELGPTPYRAIHQQLARALARLEHHVQSRQALAPLAAEVERLENAYG
jgi:geranylgeranyl pyrophosphate synthase